MPHTHARAGRCRPAPASARKGWTARARRAGRRAARAGAAAIALFVAAGPLAFGPGALAQPGRGAGRLSVFIEGVSPQWGAPGRTVTVTGVVRNGTTVAQAGLSLQLRSSGIALGSRDDLALYAAGDLAADVPEGTPVLLPAVIAPGQSVRWRATLNPSAAGMSGFGVYPLAAQVVDGVGVPVATDRTFLPFWPGGPPSQQPRKLSIAWIWPIIDQPYQAVCKALLSNSLAASLTSGGRLNELLAAGATYSAAAHLTWAIDPAVVQSAQVMGGRYAVGADAACVGAKGMRGDPAARTWLRDLVRATAGQQALLTPYADVDVAALSHDGLDQDLSDAFAEGRAVGRKILHLPASSDTIAWPPDGEADLGVLGSLAVNGIDTVVLGSTEMPPSGPVPSYTPSAQATVASGVGSSLHVLLADQTISQILAGSAAAAAPAASAASAASAALAGDPGATFATEQSFLAQTAMIVAELPATARSVVVAPPRQWDPAPGVASGLLSETVRAPWLQPVSLPQLAAVAHPSGWVPRRPPPAHRVSPGELSRAYLAQVAALDATIRLQASIFSPPDPSYLDTAVAALESADWPGDRSQAAAARDSLLGRVSSYVAAQGTKVSIIDSSQITLGGSSGRVPVSITNGLRGAVRVRLRASVPGDGRLSIGPFNSLVTIPAGKTTTIRLPVHAATVGVTDVTLSLDTPDGTPLPGNPVKLSLHATRFGALALVIMSVALAVFVLTSSARAIRRSRRDGGQSGEPSSDPPAPAAPPGTVRSDLDRGNDHPPEDPDEYADARGRARR